LEILTDFLQKKILNPKIFISDILNLIKYFLVESGFLNLVPSDPEIFGRTNPADHQTFGWNGPAGQKLSGLRSSDWEARRRMDREAFRWIGS